MNPNPSREFQLIELELAALNARTIEALKAAGFPSYAIQVVTACYYEQVRLLQASYEDEASAGQGGRGHGPEGMRPIADTMATANANARRVPTRSTEAGAWPTVDRADLHLPAYPAPDCKVIGVVHPHGAAMWDHEGYYFFDRRDGRIAAVTDSEGVTRLKARLERIPAGRDA